MTSRKQRQRRIWAALGLPFLALAAARGADAPTPSAPPARPAAAETEAPLQSARRDFEAVKAARDPVQAGARPAGPGLLTLPDFQPGPGAATLLPGKNGSEKQKTAVGTRSPTWLLDAMEKEAKQAKGNADPRANLRRERKGESGLAADAAGSDGEELGARETRATAEAAATSDAKAADDTEARRTPAENPFDRFLAGWMTPGDYALLRGRANADTSGQSGAAAAPAAGNANPGGLSADLAALSGLGGGESGRTGGTMIGPAAAAGLPRENPFLQQFEQLELRNVREPAMLAAPPAPGPAPAAFNPPPLPPPANRPVVPDFAKPERDEKHFKQLKRF